MIEQLHRALTFYFFFSASKIGKPGLTVLVDIYDEAEAVLIAGQAATEVGGGLYKYTLAADQVDAVGAYKAIAKTEDDTVDQQHLPGIWEVGVAGVGNLDQPISAVLSRFGSARVTLTSPLAADLALTLVQGDDYFAVDGRALEWVDAGNTWPALTGATVRFAAQHFTSGEGLAAAGTVLAATGPGKSVRVEIAAAQTALLTKLGPFYSYIVRATLASGHLVTLAKGTLALVVRGPR